MYSIKFLYFHFTAKADKDLSIYLSLSHTYFHTGGPAVHVYSSLPRLARTRVRQLSLSFVLSSARSLARMAAGLVAVTQPFRIAVFAAVVRCGRVRVLV